MVALTLNVIGALEVLAVGALLWWVVLSVAGTRENYQRRRNDEAFIRANLAQREYSQWNPRMTPEQVARARSLRRGVQVWRPIFKPAAALGWWLGGLSK